jgi:hypothetical protein
MAFIVAAFTLFALLDEVLDTQVKSLKLHENHLNVTKEVAGRVDSMAGNHGGNSRRRKNRRK